MNARHTYAKPAIKAKGSIRQLIAGSRLPG